MLSNITDIEALYDIKDNSIVAISGLKWKQINILVPIAGIMQYKRLF